MSALTLPSVFLTAPLHTRPWLKMILFLQIDHRRLATYISSSSHHIIGTAAYGPTWRILRRNLMSEVLNPTRIKSYSQARIRVLETLKDQLIKSRDTGDSICVIDYFRHAMFGLLAFMCFGAQLDESQFRKVERKLDEKKIVALCKEFLNAGTDPTSTSLEWIMANLVKYPNIQEKLYMEIKGVVGDATKEVKEEDLHKMPYLKAVILEGLRRHPSGHFLFHGVTKDVIFNDYLVPRKGVIVFFIEEMGLDSKIWEDPLAFKPERFLHSEEVVDITGRKEIKMIPFGVGRRMCPAHGLAMLYLEYFVANLVWFSKWKAKDGDDVDLSQKKEFTFVMKNPLQSCIYSRA